MKATNDYMTKYSLRKVLYRDCSGVFTCDGHSLSRTEVAASSSGSQSKRERMMMMPWGDPCIKSSKSKEPALHRMLHNQRQSSLSREDDDDNDVIRSRSTRGKVVLSTLEHQLAVPPPLLHRSRLDDPAAYQAAKDRYKAAQMIKAKLYARIYFDDKGGSDNDEDSTLVAVERLWFPRLNGTKALQNTCTAFVKTPAPRNHSLGLSPLRILGPSMQDKPHHISASKNVTRLITKIPSRKYTGPV